MIDDVVPIVAIAHIDVTSVRFLQHAAPAVPLPIHANAITDAP
jgi:hypothetical protein